MNNYRVYMITFNSTLAKNSWRYFNQYILDSKDFIAYWNYIPLVYMVKTALTATELALKIRNVLPDGGFLIAEVNIFNVDGVLPGPAWTWIYEDHTQPQLDFDWSQFLPLPDGS